MVSGIARNSSAWVGGVNVNDELISVDGVPVESSIDLGERKVGDALTIRVVRDGIVRDFKVTLKAGTSVKLVGELDNNASAAELKVRKRWF